MDEETALKSITIHAAMLVQLDHRIGSLEVGKDADFVVWSHPILKRKQKYYKPMSMVKNITKRSEENWRSQKSQL
ncbi:amidohydrolase family protein [Lysinibacillus pakistanensis]|uniref:amidohydrolase family protein n=1 Tax=Lysinibacillus pakistanensis TaxID=759811 RepID=UPI003D2D188E